MVVVYLFLIKIDESEYMGWENQRKSAQGVTFTIENFRSRSLAGCLAVKDMYLIAYLLMLLKPGIFNPLNFLGLKECSRREKRISLIVCYRIHFCGMI